MDIHTRQVVLTPLTGTLDKGALEGVVWPKLGAEMPVETESQRASINTGEQQQRPCGKKTGSLPVCAGVEMGVPGPWIEAGVPSAKLEGG